MFQPGPKEGKKARASITDVETYPNLGSASSLCKRERSEITLQKERRVDAVSMPLRRRDH